MTILANDGISQSGIDALTANGFKLITTKVAQEQLATYINENKVSAILVRSATKVKKDIIDKCPALKLIGRGGVGMDNIDVQYARDKGIHVINTPTASSTSVAELVFAHLYGGVRFLHDANRNMPLEGDTKFKNLKKAYSEGVELRGKTIGIIGFGRIGKEVAKIALGIGMKVIYNDSFVEESTIELAFYNNQKIAFQLKSQNLESLLKQSDFISIHVPTQKEYIIGKSELNQMKQGVAIINTARGGVIDEVALIEALDANKVLFAGLDVFENEPTPAIKVLMNHRVSLSPHIGASTKEAQERIGNELALQISNLLTQNKHD